MNFWVEFVTYRVKILEKSRIIYTTSRKIRYFRQLLKEGILERFLGFLGVWKKVKENFF